MAGFAAFTGIGILGFRNPAIYGVAIAAVTAQIREGAFVLPEVVDPDPVEDPTAILKLAPPPKLKIE